MEFKTMIKAAEMRQSDVFRMESKTFTVLDHPKVSKQLVEVQIAYTRRRDGKHIPKNRRLKVDLEVELIARTGGYFGGA